MGREIRRVPVGWEHPRDGGGYYIPLLDQTYEEAMAEYEAERAAFPSTEGEKRYAAEGGTFEQRVGEPPRPRWYREAFDPDAQLGWCFYENVTEGTPLSPVFAEPEALHQWLVEVHGYPADAAARFMVSGSAPSFVVANGVMVDGVSAS